MCSTSVREFVTNEYENVNVRVDEVLIFSFTFFSRFEKKILMIFELNNYLNIKFKSCDKMKKKSLITSLTKTKMEKLLFINILSLHQTVILQYSCAYSYNL